METNKRLDSVFQKCPNCGGGMNFDPNSQNLFCEHCASTKDFEKSKDYKKHPISEKPTQNKAYDEWKQENKTIHCKTCGAEIILHKLEYSQKCPYCNSSYVTEGKTLPSFVPDSIIPFQFNEQKAVEIFKQKVKKKFYVPRPFKKNATAENIVGIYVPSFSFDALTKSQYQGVLEESYRDADGHTHFRRFSISGTKNMRHEDLLVESSSLINQTELKGILPYDMSGAYKFSENFILGYVVEHFAQTFDSCYDDAKKAMEKQIKSSILRNYSYTSEISFSMTTNYSDEKYAYRLVPMYQLGFVYKNKPYVVQMNGQTGKIGGKMPVSGLKVFFTVLFWIVIIAGIVVLSNFC